ncbi:MAG: hypothetical protein QM500_13130 [Methylococcales bacterium]
MIKVTTGLPSIRDDESGYNFLFRLSHSIMSDPMRHFDFDFKRCAILDQNAIAMLGGLARYVDAHNSSLSSAMKGILGEKCGVMFLVDSMSPLISDQLVKNNFLNHFSKASFEGYPVGDYIGYREHTEYLDANEIARHLNDEWLSDGKLSVTPALKEAVISRIFEIFMNAYGHAIDQSRIKGLGAISCGQYNKKSGHLKLTVLDFGIGIIENVKSLLGKDIDDVSAMEWALVTGNSTRTDSLDKDMPRGLGFGLLNKFVLVNKGSLSIFSNTCSACVDDNGNYVVKKMKTPFDGTMVSITINCDDRHYSFNSEIDESEQYF